VLFADRAISSSNRRTCSSLDSLLCSGPACHQVPAVSEPCSMTFHMTASVTISVQPLKHSQCGGQASSMDACVSSTSAGYSPTTSAAATLFSANWGSAPGCHQLPAVCRGRAICCDRSDHIDHHAAMNICSNKTCDANQQYHSIHQIQATHKACHKASRIADP
jgi:hypothetical protein